MRSMQLLQGTFQKNDADDANKTCKQILLLWISGCVQIQRQFYQNSGNFENKIKTKKS